MKISGASNLFIRSFFIFIIVYLWTSYYLRGFFLILLVSITITLAINYLIKLLTKRRNDIQSINKKQLEHMRQTMLQFKFMTKAQTLSLFKAALSSKYTCTVSPKKLTVQKPEQQLEIFTLFHKGRPTESDIIECLKSKSASSKALITAESFSPEIMLLVRSLKIDAQLLDAAQVYNQILAPSEIYPETLVEIKKTGKMSLSQLKNMMFSRERTKGYVITAIVIMLSSLIIRYSIYYIIVATIVFVLALSSYFSPAQNKKLFD